MRDVTYDDEDLTPRRGRAAQDMDGEAQRSSLWRRVMGSRPGDRIALAVMALVATGIVANALARQSGPHPAPLFSAAVVPPVPAARPADVQQTATIAARPAEAAPAAPAAGGQPAARTRSDVVADVQRELQRRRLYDGTVDGMTGPKTEAAIRRFETEQRLAPTGEASEALLARLRRGAPTQAAARPAAAPAPAARAPQAPQGPQNIADLLSRDPRAVPAPRPAQAPRDRSIGDLITADSGRARP